MVGGITGFVPIHDSDHNFNLMALFELCRIFNDHVIFQNTHMLYSSLFLLFILNLIIRLLILVQETLVISKRQCHT